MQLVVGSVSVIQMSEVVLVGFLFGFLFTFVIYFIFFLLIFV